MPQDDEEAQFRQGLADFHDAYQRLDDLVERFDNLKIVGSGVSGDSRKGFCINCPPCEELSASGGTSGVPIIPPPATGACCVGLDCSIETAADCGGMGGTYQGDGVPCEVDTCGSPPTGACCATDGTCTIETQIDCESASGTYQGDGTPCEPNPCPQSTSLCCDPCFGECYEDLQSNCLSSNNCWTANCNSDTCPTCPPTVHPTSLNATATLSGSHSGLSGTVTETISGTGTFSTSIGYTCGINLRCTTTGGVNINSSDDNNYTLLCRCDETYRSACDLDCPCLVNTDCTPTPPGCHDSYHCFGVDNKFCCNPANANNDPDCDGSDHTTTGPGSVILSVSAFRNCDLTWELHVSVSINGYGNGAGCHGVTFNAFAQTTQTISDLFGSHSVSMDDGNGITISVNVTFT